MVAATTVAATEDVDPVLAAASAEDAVAVAAAACVAAGRWSSVLASELSRDGARGVIAPALEAGAAAWLGYEAATAAPALASPTDP